MSGRPGLPGPAVAALLVAAATALVPRGGAAQAPGADGAAPFFGRTYGIVAYDSAAGRLGLVAASTEFSVGSGGAHLEPGVGGVLVQGAGGTGVGRRVLDALRAGGSPAGALADLSGADGATQVAALTPACDRAADRGPGAEGRARSRSGRSGDVCYVAVGVRLRPTAGLDRLVRSFRTASGSLRERFVAALSAMEGSARNVGGSRSAVLWVAASEGGRPVLGRGELRLQVEDHGRPALALEKRLEAGRADGLARRAARSVAGAEYERAVALADSSLALDLSAPGAWLQRGRALLHLGRIEEAETAFRRMLELDPFLLRLLGEVSGGEIRVREDVIPYHPRLVLRLDLYRREYFDDLDFGPEPEPFEADSAG